MTAPISVAVVDDHTLLRGALCDMINLEPDIGVIVDAPSTRTALSKVAAQRPDVVILDVEIPGEDVRESIRAINTASPDSSVLIVTMYEDLNLVQDLLDLGISGYLHKSASREALLSAIRGRTDGTGQVVVHMSRRIVPMRERVDGPPVPAGPLTAREREVLGCVAEALSNRQIAGKLGISEGTVKRHLRRIFDKLDAVSRLDAVNRATAARMISPRTSRLG
ncbi:response regulator [Millisia brevis]|uniref:response regulator n=1 Tax=Millisia brevis TaxID=264148 RepID=UPI000830A4AD|nr:response regulator transcription factor [Millisia brevis]